MFRRTLLSAVLIFVVPLGFAGEIRQEIAQCVARNFYLSRIVSLHRIDHSSVPVSYSYPHTVDRYPVYYVVFMEPAGWVIVSGSDATMPILAYSFENNWSDDRQPPAFQEWMAQYEKTILASFRNNLLPDPLIQRKWDVLQDSRKSMADSIVSIAPLITSQWDQSPWYNEQCPADPAGPGGHALAGCVPVCMGQVMYYFRWPLTGTGSYTYVDPKYGTQSADFGSTTYLWNNMKNYINSSNPGIAQLLYHLGVSCDLQYGPDGSGMYNHKAAYSLRTFFKYSPQTQYLFRDSTTLNWDSVLIAHLERKIPMYYAGWSNPNISGHAFVCDGYQDSSYFHFNFGWGGSNDGYFYTSDLTPGPYNFNLAQEVVINCYPDTGQYAYPYGCSGDTTLPFLNGSIEDGSGPIQDYQPDADCQWLIDPQTDIDSVTSITLTFSRFSTNQSDTLTIFNGSDNTAQMLGRFSGDTLPPSLTTTGNKMLIALHANGGATAQGFLADYKTKIPDWCKGTTVIQTDTLELSDGSFRFNYHNNSNCRWRIERTDGQPLTIHFREFDTEEGKDFLRFYDLETEDTLAIISGHFEPPDLPDSITASSGKMFIQFTSNNSVTAQGWEIYYPKSHVNIDEQEYLSDVTLFPNPGRKEITVALTCHDAISLVISVLSPEGKVMIKQKFESLPGYNSFPLSTDILKPGIYLIGIATPSGSKYLKLILY
jgi:hypothetical protein